MRTSRADAVPWVIAALLAARVALAFAPGTWGWSLQLLRFVTPAVGGTLWTVAAVALIAALVLARRPADTGAARAAEASPVWVAVLLGLLVGGLVFVMSDRTWFVGDFLLRVGALDSTVDEARITPQSLPLDLWLHVDLPRWLAAAEWVTSPADAARLLGALEAGALTWLVLAFAAREGWNGRARLAFAGVTLGGSALSLMTGYGKSTCEMVLLVVAVLMLARGFAANGRGALALGLAMAVALIAHRSALVLLPAWGAAWWLAARGGALPPSVPVRAIAIGLPLVALAALAPRLAHLLVSFDLPRHLLRSEIAGRGIAATALDPVHLLDRVNIALAFAPLAPLLLIPALRSDSGSGDEALAAARRRAGVVEAALVGPAVALALLVLPQQGLFRDWDVFVIPGMLLALASARRGAAWVSGGQNSGPRAAALIASGVLGAGLWLAAGHDDRAGLARVRAFAAESPDRGPVLRGKLWEFIGDRAAELRRWDDAAVALREAVKTQPSPRLYTMLSMAEAEIGNLEAAERALAMAATKNPNVISAWAAWVLLAKRRGDEEGARTAAEGLRRLAPEHPLVRQVLGDSAPRAAAPPR